MKTKTRIAGLTLAIIALLVLTGCLRPLSGKQPGESAASATTIAAAEATQAAAQATKAACRTSHRASHAERATPRDGRSCTQSSPHCNTHPGT